MRKCIDMGEGREIIINDKDMLKPDGILEIPDIGLGESYRGKASYVVYDKEDIDDDMLELVCARKYNDFRDGEVYYTGDDSGGFTTFIRIISDTFRLPVC
mgnify:CR=1 FL=1